MQDKNARPPRGPQRSDASSPDAPSPFKNRTLWILGLLILGAIVAVSMVQNPPGARMIPYSEVKDKIRDGSVQRVILQESAIDARPTDEVREKLRESGSPTFSYWRASRPRVDDTLIPLLDEHKLQYEVRAGCGEGGMLWFWLMPLAFLLLFWNFVSRRMASAGGAGPGSPAMDFAKSRAKLYVEEGLSVTFEDVAGCDEAKEELQEVVDFLREPEKLSRLGGQVPKGVLLIGPPGTGKTLLARAVAGEAGVSFFNLSGSDFVEMFVGVGAARVRDLFKQAQEHAPCIIFVDELDAIGKSRAANQMQSNDEREQTLNALLVEMDGFDARSRVILLAATNRPEILDKALLRPGRFDRQVLVDRPDVRGREQILTVHARKIVKEEGLDLQVIASQTPGFVGADLANIVNEAALLAARAGKDAVGLADFQEAIERVMAGLEKKNRRLSEKEKNIVAYHESGHAIVAAAVDNADPVHKVSIVSRGVAALGYTLQVPIEDRYLMTRAELLDRVAILLGGRAAEQIVFKDISTGASNDLQRITDIARGMVAEYGMSERVGQVNYGDRGGQFLDGGFNVKPHADETALMIDQEIRKIVDQGYEQTLAILRLNIDLLHEMAEVLKEKEVLEGDDLQAMLARTHKLPQTLAARAPF